MNLLYKVTVKEEMEPTQTLTAQELMEVNTVKEVIVMEIQDMVLRRRRLNILHKPHIHKIDTVQLTKNSIQSQDIMKQVRKKLY